MTLTKYKYYMLSCGEYSDYRIVGFYRGPEGLDIKKIIEEYKSSDDCKWIDSGPEYLKEYVQEECDKWLLCNYELHSVDYDEIDVGYYYRYSDR